MTLQSSIYEYYQDNFAQIVLVNDDSEAKKASDALHLAKVENFVLPDFRANFGDDLRSFSQELSRINSALHRFYNTQDAVLVAPFKTLSYPLPQQKYLQSFTLEFGQTADLESLRSKLYYYGYDFVDIVESPAEVSMRGDIVDIYPPNMQNPLRISFFGDEVESIRSFAVQDQKSDPNEWEKVTILPSFLSLEAAEYEQIEQRVKQSEHEVFFKDIDSLGFWYIDGFSHNLLEKFDAIDSGIDRQDLANHYEFNTDLVDAKSFEKPKLPKAKLFKELEVADINSILEFNKNKKITLIGKNETVFRRSSVKDIQNYTHLHSDIIINLISPSEVIISLNKPSKPKKVKKSSIMLDELNLGDLVVHEDYGIGKFRSVEKRSIMGATREFVVIEYQNKDQLLVPVESLNLIDRFVSSGGVLPIVDKLGKNSFKRVKEKVKEKLFAIADELIKNAAKRLLQKARILKTDELVLFQEDAGFEYTDDQKRACSEIENDL
ncbi:MAG: CarD family transcriptional regulator, partial [Campylobacterota bacterium]